MQHATVCVSKAAPGPGRAGGLLICRLPVAAAFDKSAFSGPPFAQGLRLLRDVAATLALHRLHALPGSLFISSSKCHQHPGRPHSSPAS